MTRVLVVGAGVVGLTCAVRLAEAGYEVHVFARDLPMETTSAVAAAIWYPYRAYPPDRVTAWSATSLRTYEQLAETTPDAGVRMRFGTELLRDPTPDPWWIDAIPKLERVTKPRDGYAEAWRFETPIIDTSVYLPWLTARLTELGATLTRMALPELSDRAPLLVHCTGLAARHLAGDLSLTPVRGQVCRVAQVGLTEWLLDTKNERDFTMVVPRLNDIVLGGTAEEGDWEPFPRPATTDAIIARAAKLVPELKDAKVLGSHVGLRPVRPSVRMDTERVGRQFRVHCYGLGGAGFTMAWGCADDVLALVREEAAP